MFSKMQKFQVTSYAEIVMVKLKDSEYVLTREISSLFD